MSETEQRPTISSRATSEKPTMVSSWTNASLKIANCIIAYNSMILNSVYEMMRANGVRQAIINEFTRIPPDCLDSYFVHRRVQFQKKQRENRCGSDGTLTGSACEAKFLER